MKYECRIGPNGRVCPLQNARKIKRVLGDGVVGSPLGTRIQEDRDPWLQLPWFPGKKHNLYPIPIMQMMLWQANMTYY